MADNKTKPTEQSVNAFINQLPDPLQRADAQALVKLFQSATGEKPKMWGPSIIGFGAYHIAFSPRKAATVLYNLTGFPGADPLLAKLGKYTTGKACLNIKKLTDVDQTVLQELSAKAAAAMRARHPK